MRFKDAVYAKYRSFDLTLLAAMFVPEADADGLRFMHNWLTWVCDENTYSYRLTSCKSSKTMLQVMFFDDSQLIGFFPGIRK